MNDSSTCIYCKEDSSKARGFAHVIPEALFRNTLVLPRGGVCDKCNQYLGKLDSSLVAFPPIALILQWHGVEGKLGRSRSEIGPVKSEGQGNLRFTVEIQENSTDRHGKHTVRFAIPGIRPFGIQTFRRSLHHLALNDSARLHGAAWALHERLDPVRNYVRRPVKNEAWGIGRRETNDSGVPFRVSLHPLKAEDEGTYYIQLFHLEFLVDLFNRSSFEEVAIANGFQFLGPTMALPEASLTYRES